MDDVDKSTGNLPAVIEGVLKAMTFSKREEVKAWEQEFVPCDHTLCLNQDKPKQIGSQGISPSSHLSALPTTLGPDEYRPQPVFHVQSKRKPMALFRVW